MFIVKFYNNSIDNNVLLYCPRIITKSKIHIPQRMYKNDEKLYGGWTKKDLIIKTYNRLPRKLKKKISDI